VLRGAGAEVCTPEIDVVVKAYAAVYSVLVEYTGSGLKETPNQITRWLEKMDKVSTTKSAVGHRLTSATAVASGHRNESEAASGTKRIVPEGRGEVEKKTKMVAKPKGKAKQAEDGAGKEPEREAADDQAARGGREEVEKRAARSSKLIANYTEKKKREAREVREREARIIRLKHQGRSEGGAEEDDIEMSEQPARPELSKRKKRGDSSESDNTDEEDEEEKDVEMEEVDEINADADADADDATM